MLFCARTKLQVQGRCGRRRVLVATVYLVLCQEQHLSQLSQQLWEEVDVVVSGPHYR